MRSMSIHWTTLGTPPRSTLKCFSRAELGRRVRIMMRELQIEKSELSIALSDDAQIKELNRVYRKMNKATDVLAFPMEEGTKGQATSQGPSQAGLLLGDIILSVETTERQATARSLPIVSEATMLLAHALLHLLGWDHETKKKETAMVTETRRLCEAAGDASAVPPSLPSPSRRNAAKRSPPRLKSTKPASPNKVSSPAKRATVRRKTSQKR